MHSRPQIELSRQVRDSRYFSFNRGGRKSGVAVNLFFGGVEECNPEYEIKRTGFPVHILEYVEDGEGWVILDGEQHPLRTGCLFLYGPAIPCTILNTGRRRMKKYFLAFLMEETDLAEAYGLHAPLYFDSLYPEGVRELLAMAVAEGSNAEEGAWRICCMYLDILLKKCARNHRREKRDKERAWHVYREIRDFIETGFIQLRGMGDIAAAFELDPSYISRLFKRYGELPPYRFLLKKKLDHALDILRRGSHSVKEAAERSGFDDPYQFSRLFKKYNGISPGKIRAVRPGSNGNPSR